MKGARSGREKVTALAAPCILTIQNEDPSGTSIEHRCTARVGVAMLSLENVDHKILLVHADAGMYVAKRAGKNSIRFWTSQVRS